MKGSDVPVEEMPLGFLTKRLSLCVSKGNAVLSNEDRSEQRLRALELGSRAKYPGCDNMFNSDCSRTTDSVAGRIKSYLRGSIASGSAFLFVSVD